MKKRPPPYCNNINPYEFSYKYIDYLTKHFEGKFGHFKDMKEIQLIKIIVGNGKIVESNSTMGKCITVQLVSIGDLIRGIYSKPIYSIDKMDTFLYYANLKDLIKWQLLHNFNIKDVDFYV